MQKNTFTKATITALSHDGRGIAHINGKTTFILGGLPNETVNINYLRKHSRFDAAVAVEVIESSPDRVTPQCQHFGVCGGCSMQHLASEAQIKHKQAVLLEQLQHLGGSSPEQILSPLISQPWSYRNKARLGVKYVHAKSKVLVGFREISGRYITDCQECPVLHPSVGTKITRLQQLIATLSAFKEIPQIEVAIDDEVTALIIRHLKPLSDNDLAQLKKFAEQENFHIYLQPGGLNSIHKLWPEQSDFYLHYQLNDHQIELKFHPADFTQVNPAINQQMVKRAIELLEPNPHEKLLDLFCGIGNFTLPLARYCQTITGIEGDTQLVERARQNAQHNQLANVDFAVANLMEDISDKSWSKQSYDKILLDPPRSGAYEICQIIGKFKAERILYISCNPATLARDTAVIVKQNYRLVKAGVMDMFPHTSHVESIALFEKNK